MGETKHKAVAFYANGKLVVKSTTKRLCEFAIIGKVTLTSRKKQLASYRKVIAECENEDLSDSINRYSLAAMKRYYQEERKNGIRPGGCFLFAFTKSAEVGNKRIRQLKNPKYRLDNEDFFLVQVEKGATKARAKGKACKAAEERN